MYTGEVSAYMATTVQLALFAAAAGSNRVGTLELVDLTKITSISYGEEGNPSDQNTVLTVAIEGSVREFYVRPLNITPAQFITDWCDAIGQGGGGGSGDATSIQGVPVSATAPTASQILVYGGAEWAPATLSVPLQDAYDAGTTINTDSGVAPVLIEQTAGTGNYSLLSVSKVPAAGDAGASAALIYSGANATGATLDVNNEGSGDHIVVRSGGTNYLTIDTTQIRATASDNVGLILNGSAGTVLLQADGETGISMDATPNDLTLTGRGISINLNEAAATSLTTTAQTLVGAINELDAAVGGASSLQATYDVGATINTDTADNPVRIEQTTGTTSYSLLEVVKTPGLGDLGASAVFVQSGANATGVTLDVDNLGSGDHLVVRSGGTNYLTIDTDQIRATSSDNVGLILNGTAGTVLLAADGETAISMDATPNDLTFTARAVSINLNEAGQTSLTTTAQSLVGAINELDATGSGAPQYFGASRRQEIDDLLLATEVKLGAFTLDPTLFSGATFAFSLTATVTDAGGAAASLTVRLYDMGAPGVPVAPVLLSDIALATTGSIQRVEQVLTTSASPGVNADQIYDTERIYEVRAELTGDVGDFAEIDWAGILGT